MTIAIGDKLPEVSFLEKTGAGVSEVASADLLAGRKVVLFAVPGAYTGICSTEHVPSFIRVAEALAAKGVDEIVCVSVNDPHVMQAWGAVTGAGAAGIRMLADAASEFTKTVGMDFTAPAGGLYARSKRYALLAENGVVRICHVEVSPGKCEVSAGETLLAAL